jgi:hypothetical protein
MEPPVVFAFICLHSSGANSGDLTLLDAQFGQLIHPSLYRPNSVPVLHPTFTRYHHPGQGRIIVCGGGGSDPFYFLLVWRAVSRLLSPF